MQAANVGILEKSNVINNVIIWSKRDLIPIPYRPRGTGDRRRRSQNGFYTPASPITPSVKELISPRIRSRWVQRRLYLQLLILGRKHWNRNRILYKSQNQIQRKNHNRHITTLHNTMQVRGCWLIRMPISVL